MGKSPGRETALVVDGQGRESSLGDLLELLVSRSDLPITRIAEAAGVSRSFFYLLRDDKQIPSLESLVSLLAACNAGEVRLAEVGEPGDVVVTTGDQTYFVQLSSTRSRMASSTLRSSRSAWSSASSEDAWALQSASPFGWDAAAARPVPTSSPPHGDAETPPAGRLTLLVEYARLLRRS
jgi:hypothetical protein